MGALDDCGSVAVLPVLGRRPDRLTALSSAGARLTRDPRHVHLERNNLWRKGAKVNNNSSYTFSNSRIGRRPKCKPRP